MKISTRCRYGIRAMIYMAKQTGTEPIKRRSISKAEHIPHSYLENILLQLRKSGLITTTRGAAGGFVLKRAPDKIRMSEIVEPLEESFAPVHCGPESETCSSADTCEAHILWDRVYQAEKTILDNTTLQDLINVRRDEWVI